MIPVFHEKLADEQHQNETRKHDCKGCNKASQNAPGWRITRVDEGRIADISGRVDADGSRSALADSHYVRELSHCHPMIMSHDLALNHRNHGISPAKTEKSDKEEGPEKL